MKTRYLALFALSMLLVVPSGAEAATFCVHEPEECVGTVQPNLQAALDAAAANGSGRDEIRVGKGLFNDGPAVNVVGSPVDVVGEATNKTAITTNSTVGGLVILDVREPTSTISHLRVHHKSNAPTATGIYLAGEADDVMVTNQLTGQFDGIRVVGTASSIDDASVSLVYPPDKQNRGIFVPVGADTDVDDSYVEATVGVSAAGNVVVDRTRIRAAQGVVAGGGSNTAVRDTEIKVPGPMDSNFQETALAAAGTGTTTLDADRVTAHSTAAGSFGVWAVPNGGANTVAVDLQGSILHGFATALLLSEPAGSTVTMTADWSAFDLDSVGTTGTPSYTAGAELTDLESTDPGFLEPATGDLRLRYDSPLIDAGDSAYQPFLGGLDLVQNWRVRDGDASGSPSVVDLGAREYQREGPVAVAEAAPANVAAGQLVTFFAQDSDDVDGDALTYGWTFDDGATAIGPAVQHAFATGGAHTATVTVTDPTGLADTATATVAVSAPPPSRQPNGAGATAPAITELKLSPARFRAAGGKPRGDKPATAAAKRPPRRTAVSYRLSAAADVRFTVLRPALGRRVGGTCRKPKPANRGAKRCVRWIEVGGFAGPGKDGLNGRRFGGRIRGKALKPSRYRLRAVATNAGGSSTARTARFRILR